MFRCGLAKAAWFLGFVLAGMVTVATASQSYYDTECSSCHGAAPANPRTCTGCHYHATHPATNSGVDVTQFNLTATVNPTTYKVGDTISVTVAGGNNATASWMRLRLLDANGTQLNACDHTTVGGCGIGKTLTTRAVAGMTQLKVAWYGNKAHEHANAVYARDKGGQTVDSTSMSSPNHTEETILTNTFSVTDTAPAGGGSAAAGGGGGGSLDLFGLLVALFGAGRARRR